jgi:6-phosphogluconolactonase
MKAKVTFEACANRQAASRAAAERLAAQLREDLEHRESASLVVSGGTTPETCFDLLSEAALDWARVTIVPSDERWVPAGDPHSNEGLIRRRLLRGKAGAARLLPLYRPGLDPAAAPAAVERDLAGLGDQFSGVLLGMGADGHFASLFPDFEALPQAVDPDAKTQCVVVHTAGSPLLRISLTLAALVKTPQIALLFFGDEKRAVFEAADGGDARLPVAALLAQEAVPVAVLWAP